MSILDTLKEETDLAPAIKEQIDKTRPVIPDALVLAVALSRNPSIFKVIGNYSGIPREQIESAQDTVTKLLADIQSDPVITKITGLLNVEPPALGVIAQSLISKYRPEQ